MTILVDFKIKKFKEFSMSEWNDIVSKLQGPMQNCNWNNLNYSLFYIILTFLISSYATYNIHYKNQNHSIYLTNNNGQITKYERTEERVNTIKETIRYLNSKKGK